MKMKMILAEKKNRKNVNTVSSEATLKEVASALCDHGIGAILVTDPQEPERHIGIISERDILKRCCTDDDFRSVKVKDAMSRDLLVAKEDDDVDYVMRVMSRRHIRHVPVINDESEIVGVISIRDIINTMLEEDKITIRHLSDYASGMRRSEVY
jgi:CBS domain-containing protein